MSGGPNHHSNTVNDTEKFPTAGYIRGEWNHRWKRQPMTKFVALMLVYLEMIRVLKLSPNTGWMISVVEMGIAVGYPLRSSRVSRVMDIALFVGMGLLHNSGSS
jgi:hypothetical protein